jgi:hypothetical protein
MKDIHLDTTTIVVLLVVALTLFINVGSPSSPKEFVIDKPRSEGFVAFIVNEKSFDSEGGDVQNECECNGTKELIHGDGHKTPCPCTESPEGCKCRSAQPVTQGEIKNTEQAVKCENGTCSPSSSNRGRWGRPNLLRRMLGK